MRAGRTGMLARLRAPEPTITVELRPPRSGLSYAAGMDAWIDMYHTLERLARDDRYIFLTDNAVDAAEEESLGHVAANLARGVPASRIIPFLTAKHSLDYCMMFARRAVSSGCEALAVVGGDTTGPPPRCVEHGYQLRDLIRCEFPSLTLGGWANPHADPAAQVDYIARGDFEADFFLTQIVSHHSLPVVERFLEELDRRGVRIPAIFGVFFYRSANPRTLRRLSRFLPIPAGADHPRVRRGGERRGDLRAQHPGAAGSRRAQHLPGESGLPARGRALPRGHAGAGEDGGLRRARNEKRCAAPIR